MFSHVVIVRNMSLTSNGLYGSKAIMYNLGYAAATTITRTSITGHFTLETVAGIARRWQLDTLPLLQYDRRR